MIGEGLDGKVTEREAMPRLPTSGQIMGALVAGLGINHPALQNRTARRYFSADPDHLVKDSTREEIVGAIAEVLTDSGLVVSPNMVEDKYEPRSALASMLRWHADHWDLLRSFLRRRTTRVQPGNLPKVWEAYVRLAVVDLALRVAAHLHLAGSLPEALDFLACASRPARGNYLNQMRREAALSLEELAAQVDADDHTVDSWMYHGTRPSNDNLTRIAQVLADRIETSTPSGIALELRALYWISDVGHLLAGHIGAEAVDTAIGRLHQYAGAAYRIIEDQFPAKDRTAILALLADLGVGARRCESPAESVEPTGAG